MEVDRRREVLRVAEAARFALDAHDLAAESFRDAGRDRVLDITEHAVEMPFEHRGGFFHGVEARADGPAVPAGKEAPDGGLLAERPL